MLPPILDIATLKAAYRDGRLSPVDVAEAVIERCAASSDPAIWIERQPDDAILAQARALVEAGPPRDDQPLWGLPFGVKDNIDCAGLPTTAACPAFAYRPHRDAVAVARLRAAGALLVGKTNLDQFATGLNGTRSPYGAPRSVFDPRYISGGSSSGSAVAVASGQVSFALGTDTAGSGRVPAAFNNIVGVKPTRGLVSTTGLVPACRSLDCITMFAANAGDADLVRRVVQAVDPDDPYSRAATPRPLPRDGLRVGVLDGAEREFYGDAANEALYDAAAARLEAFGATIVPIDYAPFRECALLLYEGPWVAERLAAIETFADAHAEDMDPTVRAIVESARGKTAVDAFRGQYALEAYRARAAREWAKMDVLLLPTAPTTYTVEAMRTDPVTLNSRLGRYTNFVNLLDCCGIAVPAGFRPDGLPFGVTLIAPAFCDDALAALADRLHRAVPFGMGADRTAALPGAAALVPEPEPEPDAGCIEIAVVGAHLSGMPLNSELVGCGGVLRRACRTTPDYRLYVLPATVPPKPGLIREPGFAGPGIEVELWALPAESFGRLVAAIPAPLGIGKIALSDGSRVSGFLCEGHAAAGAEEITWTGGWRNYVGRQTAEVAKAEAQGTETAAAVREARS